VNKQWWLISIEDIEKIRAFLLKMALKGSGPAADALHALDSGLHLTDAVPDDFKDEEHEKARTKGADRRT
jgi:hypothetical protein